MTNEPPEPLKSTDEFPEIKSPVPPAIHEPLVVIVDAVTVPPEFVLFVASSDPWR